jgi:hypothetical protein
MAFVVTGVTTVTDVRDGVTPASVLLTNESHTFQATSEGVISDLTGFATSALVFVGTDSYAYTTSATPTGSNFTIVQGSIAVQPAGADLSVSVDGSGEITISDGGGSSSGFDDSTTVNNVTITIPVKIAGFAATVNKVITLSKSLGGFAPVLRLTTNTQTVEYDQDGSIARTANIELQADEINFETHAAAVWEYKSGAGSFTALSGVTGVTITSSTTTADPETVAITPAAYNTLLGSNRVVIFRARRGGTTSAPLFFDQISIARINDGASAITVVVGVTSGSNILRSDTDVVVLRADVYQAGTLLTPGGDWTYAWSKDGTALTSANQASLTGATQQSGEGYNERSLRVEGDGITDNTAALFSVVVTDPT